jgi:carboxypeptidase C (cathepsin A)
MKTNWNVVAGITALVLLAVGTASGQGRPQQQRDITIPPGQQPPQQQQRTQTRTPEEQQPTPLAPEQGQTQPPRRGPAPEEKSVVTHHSARIGGQQINYTATAGTYIIKAEDDTPKATFFFVAYTKDDVPENSKRPVSFVYNGGPGAASLFTHMGLGPKRVLLTPDGHGMPAPYQIVDDEDSFLDATDLVFVDAIGTGYSRPAPGQSTAQFYGIIEDANYFSDFIYQYVTRNERWDSPKFLIGESYGTTRSAELAGVLQQRHEIYMNGIVLVSSVAFANWGADDRFIFFLPTYVTTAWYHHLLPPDLQKENVESVAQAARQFAHSEYAQALEKGDELAPSDHKKVVQDMARFTGLSSKYIEESNLRISPQRWFKELLRDQRKTTGRLDSRFTGMDVDAAGERDEYDPSEASYEGAFTATFQDYLRRELGWKSEARYLVSGNVRPWDQTGNTAVAEVLRSAMTQQSNLKVLVVCGYYDVATPFNGIEQTVSHMSLEPSMRKNISFAYYESGHMVYIDRKAHDKLHKDVDDFINASYPR